MAICELRKKIYLENVMRSFVCETLGTHGGHDLININKVGEDRAWICQTVESVQCFVMSDSIMFHCLP
jgi:hypothetical protein